jgi:hypothetical protein
MAVTESHSSEPQVRGRHAGRDRNAAGTRPSEQDPGGSPSALRSRVRRFESCRGRSLLPCLCRSRDREAPLNSEMQRGRCGCSVGAGAGSLWTMRSLREIEQRPRGPHAVAGRRPAARVRRALGVPEPSVDIACPAVAGEDAPGHDGLEERCRCTDCGDRHPRPSTARPAAAPTSITPSSDDEGRDGCGCRYRARRRPRGPRDLTSAPACALSDRNR